MAIAITWRSPDGDVEVYRVSPRASVRVHLAELLATRRRTAADGLRLQHGLNGKPFVPGGPEFSIAHVEGFSLLAIGNGTPIGIDAERIRPIPEAAAIARMLFAPAECEQILRLEGFAQTQAFFRAWVTLEAKVKARGQALAEVGALDGLRTFAFMPEPDVYAVLATEAGTKDSSGTRVSPMLEAISLTPEGYMPFSPRRLELQETI